MTKRQQLAEECLNYKTNFRGIDQLVIQEHNYMIAITGGYNFEGCPQSYDCLEHTKELCSDLKPKENECKKCWEIALNE